MRPPIHPSQFDPLIDARRTHLSGGHGRYKRPPFSPALIDKRFSPVELEIRFPFLPLVILRTAFVAPAKNARKGQRCRRDVWILNSRRDSKNRSDERTAPPWKRHHYRYDASRSSRGGGGGGADFMDLAAIHQQQQQPWQEIYTENLRAVMRDSLTLPARPFAAIKCASRRIAPLFSDGAERSILPSPRPANWSVYNTFNYPVRSFCCGKADSWHTPCCR